MLIKKFIPPFFLLCMLMQNFVFAQREKKLKKILELKIPGTSNTNGASVTWNPLTKKYYAAMAGDKKSFIGVYNSSGKLLSPSNLETGVDIRGLWYNTKTKTIQLNGYKDFGWAEYKLDTNGFPAEIKILHAGTHQPNEQSVGCYDAANNYVYFCFESTILTYDYITGNQLEKPVELNPEEEHDKKKTEEKTAGAGEEEDEGGDFNTTSLIFTAIKGREFGLINYAERKVVLFNMATGKKYTELSLPAGVPVYSLLNFSYCNGIYWLFDKKSRAWKGYK